MKQYDQREIDRRYGTGTDGQLRRIRGAPGTVVPNMPANRAAVQEMERRFSCTKAPARQYVLRYDAPGCK
jgi:hypothetical protein